MKIHRNTGLGLALATLVAGGTCLVLPVFRSHETPAPDPGKTQAAKRAEPGALPSGNAMPAPAAGSSRPDDPVPSPPWEHDLLAGDDAAKAAAVAGLDACPPCQSRVHALLRDPERSLAERMALARTLVGPGTRQGTVAVVQAIRDAGLVEDLELREGLLEALADATNPDAAAGLADIVAGAAEGVAFQDLPEDLRNTVQKAIRLNPDGEATGRLLAKHYQNQPAAEARRDLEATGQPWMFSTLAENAQSNGQAEDAARYVDRLAALNDPHTLDAIGDLVEQGVIPPARAADLALGWAAGHGQEFAGDRYAAWLSDPDINRGSRSVAAYALAGSPNRAEALPALAKAVEQEPDPELRAAFASALGRAQAPGFTAKRR